MVKTNNYSVIKLISTTAGMQKVERRRMPKPRITTYSILCLVFIRFSSLKVDHLINKIGIMHSENKSNNKYLNVKAYFNHKFKQKKSSNKLLDFRKST
jgi:hypothetical protein